MNVNWLTDEDPWDVCIETEDGCSYLSKEEWRKLTRECDCRERAIESYTEISQAITAQRKAASSPLVDGILQIVLDIAYRNLVKDWEINKEA